jgi:hypothetical protein
LAAALASGGNWRDAARAYRRALDRGVRPQFEVVGFLFSIGHVRAASEAAQRNYVRDPEGANTIGTNFLMLVLEALGDTRGSDRMFDVGRGLFEDWRAGTHGRLVVLMGRARAGQIDSAVVSRYFRDTYASIGPWHMELARRFDDREAVAGFLRERIGLTRTNPFNQLDIATHAAYVDEPELALEAFQNASSYFAINSVFLWTPLFREVRQLDEFKAHMREIGMVDVWREIGWPDLCEATGGEDFRCD